MSEMQKELQKVTKIKPNRNESRADYLGRLVQAIDGLSDEGWDELSKSAQKWANQATKAYEASKPIKDFPDAEEAESDPADAEEKDEQDAAGAESQQEAGDEDVEAEDEAEAEAPVSKSSKEKAVTSVSKAKKATTAKSKSKSNGSAEAAAPKKLGTGAPTIIKQLLLKNASMSKEDLLTALKKKNIKVSDLTAGTIRSDFRHSLRVLQDADMLKGSIEL